MAQVLGIQQPVLFESGGGLFDPVSASVSWSPNLTDDIRREIDEVAAWMLRECIPGSSMIFDYAKRTQAGVIGPDPDEIAAHVPLVEAFVEQNGLTLNVLPTYLSIDVVPDGITKDTGVEWLSKTLGVSLSNMAYIGDSIGDLGAMRSVGLAFAPENAMSAVKEEVDYITSARLQGVLDAIELCVERNRSGVESEPIK
jgi:hydroxymethylpyrimidine pyrophosphatase-like HAD family hydrolase